MTDATDQPNAVERALAAAIADPSLQGGLQLALLSAQLYVVPTDEPPPAGKVFGIDVPFNLQGIVLKTGERAAAVFTTPDRARTVFDDAPLMGMFGQHALEMLGTGWIVLNPGAEHGLVLSPSDSQTILASMADARLTNQDDLAVDVTMPEQEPSELVDRLRRVLNSPLVKAAWLGRTVDRATAAEGWHLDVQTQAVFANLKLAVEQAAVGLDFHGATLDIVARPPEGPDGIGIRIV